MLKPVHVMAATLLAAEEAATISVAQGLARYHRTQATIHDPGERLSDAMSAGLVAERYQAIADVARARSRTRDEVRAKALLVAGLSLEDAPDVAVVAALATSIAADVDAL